jgi:hypothetical protein
MLLMAWSLALFCSGCGRFSPNNEPSAVAQNVATEPKPSDKFDASTATPAQSEVGRYTIIHSPQIERDTMLLDTETGDTWQLVQTSKDGDLAWQSVKKSD